MALAGIDTDRERIDAWNEQNAISANRVVGDFGIERKGLVEEDLIGYNPPFLDGLWLRAPYLPNGPVPTLRDPTEPPAQRPEEPTAEHHILMHTTYDGIVVITQKHTNN